MSDILVTIAPPDVIAVTVVNDVVNVTVTPQPDIEVTITDGIGPQGAKGDTGDTGAKIVDVDFVLNDMVFTLDDASTATLVNAKIDLKGDQGYTPVKGVDYFDGADGEDGREVQLQKSVTHIQWKYDTDLTWTDLIALSDLKGSKGDDGLDGKSVELQNNGTYIQWRLVGDTTWINIVSLLSLKGDKGDPGNAGYTPIKGVDYFDGVNGQGVPTGGTAGQILAKIDNTNYNTEWKNDSGGIPDAPSDGKQYARKDAGWVEVTASGGDMTFNTTLNFGANKRTAYATITDTSMTLTKIIQCFYTDKLEEVVVLNMRVAESARTAGVGFNIVGVAPDGASGIYAVRIITSGA